MAIFGIQITEYFINIKRNISKQFFVHKTAYTCNFYMKWDNTIVKFSFINHCNF